MGRGRRSGVEEDVRQETPHVARGAQSALADIDSPAYASLFIATVNAPAVHPFVRNSLLRNLCGVKCKEATGLVTTFVRERDQPEADLRTVVECLAYRGDLLPLVEEIATWSDRPALAGEALRARFWHGRNQRSAIHLVPPKLFENLAIGV